MVPSMPAFTPNGSSFARPSAAATSTLPSPTFVSVTRRTSAGKSSPWTV